MKSKKRGIFIACIVIVVIAVLFAVFYPFIADGLGIITANRYIGQDLKNVDNIVLIAECPEVDGVSQSISGIKEAVRLGADAVKVDLCFRTDGTPVITDKYENNADADTVEDLFIGMNEEKYRDIRIYFNIVQLSSLTELNRLTVKYNMVDRIYLMGIDESHYGLVTSDSTIVPFLLKYDFTQEDIRSIEEGLFSAPDCIAEYGAGGLEIDCRFATEQIVTTLDDFGIPFIVSGIGSLEDLCKALLSGATHVVVDDIRMSADMLNDWIDAMRERHSISVEQSIKELNNK